MKRVFEHRLFAFLLFAVILGLWVVRLALNAPLQAALAWSGDWANPIIKAIFFCVPVLWLVYPTWLERVVQGWVLGVAVGLGYALLRFFFDEFFGDGKQDWSPLLALVRHLVDAPILEETLFRLVLLPLLLKHHRFKVANLLQSLMFLSIHLPGWTWQQLPLPTMLEYAAGVLVVGLVCGWLVQKSGSVWAGVGFHWFWNLTTLCVVLA